MLGTQGFKVKAQHRKGEREADTIDIPLLAVDLKLLTAGSAGMTRTLVVRAPLSVMSEGKSSHVHGQVSE